MDPSLKTRTQQALLAPARFFNNNFAYGQRLAFAMSRGALNVSTRQVDPLEPSTWEFSAFSQNGEDGITDHLLSLIPEPNRYFVEIGASNGLENNSSYLAFAKKYCGLMVDGDEFKIGNAKRFLGPMNWGLEFLQMYVEPSTVPTLVSRLWHQDPDYFSLDIDSNDYYVMKALLAHRLRPKVLCVEYNSAFGPDQSVTVNYTPGLDYLTYHPSQLYYGVSVRGWMNLLADFGYQFVTVDTRGVNAFFVAQEISLPTELQALAFAENVAQFRSHRAPWQQQFEQIASLPLTVISGSS
jgi:hypothetical protein